MPRDVLPSNSTAQQGDGLRLIVRWCPRCKVQSERAWHFCEKGPPLIPQLDVETKCEEIEVVPAADHRGAVGALLAAPMPERESIHKGEDWTERYADWWHEHVRPHVIGGQSR